MLNFKIASFGGWLKTIYTLQTEQARPIQTEPSRRDGLKIHTDPTISRRFRIVREDKMSAKRIRNRFSKPCRRCKQMIPAGQEVFWRKGYGIYHLACETPEDSRPKTPVDFTYALEWSDLKSAWKSFVGGNDKELDRNLPIGERFRSRWQKDSSRAWTGATTDDMPLWLAAGYRVEGLKMNPALVPTRERRKLRFSEEGELQIDLAMSGFDYPFLEWQKRIARPGMTVNVALQFNHHTPAETVAAYAKWVARAI